MTRRNSVTFEFVDYIPEQLEDGVVYMAPEFGAVMHLYCDGCGERVSTPLHPGQWTLTFDGETISLSPSIGNWELPCKSHYFIRRNRVVWAGEWSDERAAQGVRDDRDAVVTQPESAPNALSAAWSRLRAWVHALTK
ncbi:DUF6527 family protein [Luethyella okanaganae]|uniref:DUF6527 family protein n=1 Tax=Luethyella okanaganae TaxID=69372 RepID=A0ABW1VEQ6_9MICO